MASEQAILSHVGIFCRDLEAMVAFYGQTFGLQVTDRGRGRTFQYDLVFMSADPAHHHQLVLAGGRPPEAAFSTVMQLSFKVESLAALRAARDRALANGGGDARGLNHGNAISVYLSDPEGNTVEIYMDTPWYVAQPHGDPLDLDRPDEQIMQETEAICRADPTFAPREAWQAELAGKLRKG